MQVILGKIQKILPCIFTNELAISKLNHIN
jgi:hypothetical protein